MTQSSTDTVERTQTAQAVTEAAEEARQAAETAKEVAADAAKLTKDTLEHGANDTLQFLGIPIDIRACPYLDNEAKNRLNRQQNKANCADNIGILSNNLTQFCQI